MADEQTGTQGEPVAATDTQEERSGSMRPLFAFAALVAAFEIAYQLFAGTAPSERLTEGLAELAVQALSAFDESAYVQGSLVRTERVSVDVGSECDGLQLCALWLSAVLAFPVGWGARLAGVLAGVLWIQLWNVVRIASLVVIGVHTNGFVTAHVYAWPALLTAITVGSWLVWAGWAAGRDAGDAQRAA